MNNNNVIKGAIFGCDGTLLDSLGAWRSLEEEVARQAGVLCPVTPEEHKLFTTFTIPEVARYFHEQYGFGQSTEAVKSHHGRIHDGILRGRSFASRR